MRWKDLNQEPCPIARSLAILGDRWTLLILRDCFFGVRRFEAFQSSLSISRAILRDRLNQLVENELLMRRAYQDNPNRFEYRLTAKGKSLHSVMLMLADWGNHHAMGEGAKSEGAVGDGAPLVEHEHKTCIHVFRPVVTCSACGDEVRARDVMTMGVGRARH